MAMRYAEYYALRRQLAPGLRSNQECYASVLDRLVTPTTRWLDAGCGHQVFPWAPELEAALVERAAFAAGCDLDEPAMRKHPFIRRVASANLEALPYREASFTLLSANMVVEHIARPAAVFSEFARVLAPSGQVVLHTPNAWSYFVLAARCVPERYRRRLASHIDGRPLEDVFPTHYRANRLQRRSLSPRCERRYDPAVSMDRDRRIADLEGDVDALGASLSCLNDRDSDATARGVNHGPDGRHPRGHPSYGYTQPNPRVAPQTAEPQS